MMLPSVCVVSPIRESVPAPAIQALVDTIIDYTRRGGRILYRTNWRASVLPQARNLLVREALATDADYVLWHDADLVPRPGYIDALLELDVDIACGAFCRRDGEGRVVGEPLVDAPLLATDVIPMRRIGFGWVLMRRAALRKMHDAHGGGLFECPFDGHVIVGEDYDFSDKWRATGGELWMHTAVRLGHVGPHLFEIPSARTSSVP